MNMRDKAIDALSQHADLDDPTGTSIALDAALDVAMALIEEAQADAWDKAVKSISMRSLNEDADLTDALWYVFDHNPYRDA